MKICNFLKKSEEKISFKTINSNERLEKLDENEDKIFTKTPLRTTNNYTEPNLNEFKDVLLIFFSFFLMNFFLKKIQRSRINLLDEILNKLSESVNEGFNSKDFQKIKDCIINMVETLNNVSKTEIMVFLFTNKIENFVFFS